MFWESPRLRGWLTSWPAGARLLGAMMSFCSSSFFFFCAGWFPGIHSPPPVSLDLTMLDLSIKEKLMLCVKELRTRPGGGGLKPSGASVPIPMLGFPTYICQGFATALRYAEGWLGGEIYTVVRSTIREGPGVIDQIGWPIMGLLD